jgi:hypothetical protein
MRLLRRIAADCPLGARLWCLVRLPEARCLANSITEAAELSIINRLVASSTNANGVHTGLQPSNQACSERPTCAN